MEQIDTLDWTRVLYKVRKTKWRRRKKWSAWVLELQLSLRSVSRWWKQWKSINFNYLTMFDCRDSPSNSTRLFHLVYMLCYALHFVLLLLFCYFLCKLKTESHSLALQWRLSETPSALLCCRAHSIENRNEIKSRFGAAFNVTQIFLSSRRLGNFHFEVTCSRHTMGKRKTSNNENENDFVFV